MFKRMNFVFAAIVASGLVALDPVGASAMPVAPKGAVTRSAVDMGVEPAHLVRVCRYGRCWWSRSGHFHGGFAWRRPYHRGWGWGGYHRGWGHRQHRRW